MNWLLESPWPAVTLGVVAQAVLVIGLIRTRQAKWVFGMIAAAVVTGALVLVERLVVTETEAVQDALDGTARALETNDTQAVLDYFTTNSPRLAEVRSALSHVTVREARVGGDLEVRLNRLTSPPSATTFFTGRISAKDARGAIPYEQMIRKFKVTLHREQGRWRIFDYDDVDPRGGGKSPAR